MTASTTKKRLLGKFRLTSVLLVETGLHIGGGGENLNIGGLDKPVIRDPLTRYPYLPGSSIKGKMRSILERFLNKPLNRESAKTYRYESDDIEDGFTEVNVQPGELRSGTIEVRNRQGRSKRILLLPYQGARTCQLSRVFGSTGKDCWIETDIANRDPSIIDGNWQPTIHNGGKSYSKIKGRNAPARLIVRDCHLLDESAKLLERIDTGLHMTEWKFENGLDRITAAANPRQVERVPKGAKFHFEIVYTVEDVVEAVEDLKHLVIALAILQDDALGGHGSRGYGKVSFIDIKFFPRSLEQYYKPSDSDDEPFLKFHNISELLKQFGILTNEIQKFLPEGESEA